MVQKWYVDFYGSLQGTYCKACGVSSSNPSWGRRRSGGRVGRFVRTWESLSWRGEWGAVYQGCMSGTRRVLKPSQSTIGGNPSTRSVGFRRAPRVDDLLWLR